MPVNQWESCNSWNNVPANIYSCTVMHEKDEISPKMQILAKKCQFPPKFEFTPYQVMVANSPPQPSHPAHDWSGTIMPAEVAKVLRLYLLPQLNSSWNVAACKEHQHWILSLETDSTTNQVSIFTSAVIDEAPNAISSSSINAKGTEDNFIFLPSWFIAYQRFSFPIVKKCMKHIHSS